jgi:hypothetical protein
MKGSRPFADLNGSLFFSPNVESHLCHPSIGSSIIGSTIFLLRTVVVTVISSSAVHPQYRRSTDAVQTQYRHSTDAVQTQYRRSTDAVQTQYRRTTDISFCQDVAVVDWVGCIRSCRGEVGPDWCERWWPCARRVGCWSCAGPSGRISL